MSKIALEGNASGTGTLTIAAPNTSTDRTLTLPDASGTIDRLNRAGNVLQVVEGNTSTSVLVSTNTYTDSGLSASITPTSATSKILVLIQQAYVVTVSSTGGLGAGVRLLRGSTTIYDPSAIDAAGPYLLFGNSLANLYDVAYLQYLDSPATTSSTTYKTQGRPYNTSASMAVRFQPTGSTQNATSRIILMEIAA